MAQYVTWNYNSYCLLNMDGIVRFFMNLEEISAETFYMGVDLRIAQL